MEKKIEKEMTNKFETYLEGKEVIKTNTGFIYEDINYVYGQYIIAEGIENDVDGDLIVEDVLYANDPVKNEYHKLSKEDFMNEEELA